MRIVPQLILASLCYGHVNYALLSHSLKVEHICIVEVLLLSEGTFLRQADIDKLNTQLVCATFF